MKITFIAHSAFLVEWDKFYTLFDYVYEPDYTGTLPPLGPQKPLLVFSSHSHEDHFDGKVFGLLEQYPLTQFFVSRDTRLTERRRKWLGISDEAFAHTTVLRPDSILLTEAAIGNVYEWTHFYVHSGCKPRNRYARYIERAGPHVAAKFLASLPSVGRSAPPASTEPAVGGPERATATTRLAIVRARLLLSA